jgi:hypothetical protein
MITTSIIASLTSNEQGSFQYSREMMKGVRTGDDEEKRL